MLGLLVLLLVLPCAAWATLAVAGPRITDDAGRQVDLPAPARHIVLTDGMGLLGLMLIDPDPVARLAGWNRARLDSSALSVLAPALPGLDAVPDIGEPATGGSVEALIALAPDLVVLDPYYAERGSSAITTLQAAGIPVAVLALTPNIRAPEPHAGLLRLGTLIGQNDRARAYAAFADARIARIRDRLADLPDADRPPVLIEAHAGAAACCMVAGAGQGIGDFIGFAGGTNIGAAIVPGMSGSIAAEYAVKAQPRVYIGTGGSYLAARGGLVAGPGVPVEQALASLRQVVARPGVAQTPAVDSGRAWGIWHGLAVSAWNVVAIEALARWIHPERFADTDPGATLHEIETRFSAAPLPGTLWIGVTP